MSLRKDYRNDAEGISLTVVQNGIWLIWDTKKGKQEHILCTMNDMIEIFRDNGYDVTKEA